MHRADDGRAQLIAAGRQVQSVAELHCMVRPGRRCSSGNVGPDAPRLPEIAVKRKGFNQHIEIVCAVGRHRKPQGDRDSRHATCRERDRCDL